MGSAESNLTESDPEHPDQESSHPTNDTESNEQGELGQDKFTDDGDDMNLTRDDRKSDVIAKTAKDHIVRDSPLTDTPETKETVIVGCLDSGKNVDEVVDLWELRNLCVSSHGLVEHSLRRRAWPKLLSVHDYIASGTVSNNSTSGNVLSATPEEMAFVRKLCQHGTAWNIMDYWKEIGDPAEQQDDQEWEVDQDMSQQLSFMESSSPESFSVRRVSFDLGATPTTPTSNPNNGIGMHTPASATSFETAEEVENADNCDALFSPNKKGPSPLDIAGSLIVAAVSLLSPMAPKAASTESSRVPQTPSSPLQRRSSLRTSPTAKRQKQERQTLSNIIIHVLRSKPPLAKSSDKECSSLSDSDSKETPSPASLRYRPYSGVQNVAAMLLMQLKSPSLASLALSQLASYQLQEYFCSADDGGSSGEDDSTTATTTRVDDYCYMTLLERVDPELYQRIANVTDAKSDDDKKQTPSFIRDSWRPCWFTNDIPNIEVVARLWDMLIVSHPLCSVYISVALSVHFRSHLLGAPSDEDVLPTLNGIVGSTGPLLTCSDPLEVTDKIVELTLAYMEQMPPASLITKCCPQTCISPPIWATAAVAPTDYAVLKHSKELRGTASEAEPTNDDAEPSSDQVVNEPKDAGKSDIIATKDSHVSTVDRFPRAAVAAGIVPITRQPDEDVKPGQDRSNGVLFFALLLLMATVVFIIANGWIVDGSGKYWGIRQAAREALQKSSGPEANPSISSLGSTGALDVDLAPKFERKPVSARPATVAKTSQDSKNRGETNGELDSQKKVPGRRVPLGSAGEAELEALEEAIFSKDALLLAQRNLERVSRKVTTPDSSAGGGDVVDERESGESSADQGSLLVVKEENPAAEVGEDQKGQNQDRKVVEEQPAGDTAGAKQTRLSKVEEQGRQAKGGDIETTNSPEQRSPQDDTKVDPSTTHDKRTSKKDQGRKDAERLAQSTSEQARQAKEQARLMVAQLRGEDVDDASPSQNDGSVGSNDKEKDAKQQNKSQATQTEAMQKGQTPEAVLAKNYKLMEKLSRVWVDPNIESVEKKETPGQKDPLQKKVAQGLATYWKRIRSKA